MDGTPPAPGYNPTMKSAAKVGAQEVTSMPVMISGKCGVDCEILLRFRPCRIRGSAPRLVKRNRSSAQATIWPPFHGISRVAGGSPIRFLPPFHAPMEEEQVGVQR